MKIKLGSKTKEAIEECRFPVDEIRSGLETIFKAISGVHCGCCGKWIPDQANIHGYGWGLCDECEGRGTIKISGFPAEPAREESE